ncbi:UDP-N-acetylglucosamine 2-epimerase (hydrolyzing) [Rhizobium sp. CRIBSB]|nr:UDP-N-acetylglucosamine 2-epimerase (hydrolyzing) [Rhizobium sp. CRIBSB]
MSRIAVVTAGRAEYGLLSPVMRAIAAAPGLELLTLVTGTHLEPAFGETVQAITADGFHVDARIPMALGDDSPAGIAASMGLALSGVVESLVRLKPDLMLVLGDRFESLSAVQAAMLAGVPVGHIAGGDITEGAFDDGIRHAITKLSHLHFATNAQSADRIRQMGEDPARVHVTGSPGLDVIRLSPAMDRTVLEALLGAPLGDRNMLVTFHPVTLAQDNGLSQFQALLAALDTLPARTVKWITRPNADPGHAALNATLDAWARTRSDVRVHASLGQTRYLGLMGHVDAVVGNSSSGLYEAPSFRIPTIDIGDRQGGRLAAASVIRCAPTLSGIVSALAEADTLDCSAVINPYGDGHASERIVAVLNTLADRRSLLAKAFHEVSA